MFSPSLRKWWQTRYHFRMSAPSHLCRDISLTPNLTLNHIGPTASIASLQLDANLTPSRLSPPLLSVPFKLTDRCSWPTSVPLWLWVH